MKKPVQGYSDTVSTALLAMCHYYDGSSNIKPDIQWPNTLHIKVDTMTAEDFLDQLDQADNSASMLRLRSITARLNELIPVIVRMKLGSGAPDSNDFIFWYEPSDELFAALPPAQAEAFRQKLAQPPHCLTAPNAVLTQAEITYCVAEPQGVQISFTIYWKAMICLCHSLLTLAIMCLSFDIRKHFLPGMYSSQFTIRIARNVHNGLGGKCSSKMARIFDDGRRIRQMHRMNQEHGFKHG